MAYKRISPQTVTEGGTGTQTLTGVITGNGTSAFTANSITQYATLVGGSSNAVSNVSSVGTSGQVLTSNGAGANPTFQDIPGGTNNWVFIETQSAEFASSIDFTDSAIGNYTNFCFMWRNLGPQTAGANINFRLSTDGGSSFLSSGYISGVTYNAYNANTWTNQNQTTAFYVQYNGSSTVQGVGVMYVSLKNGENSISGNNMYLLNGTDSVYACIQGRQTSSGIDAFQFIASTGNIAGQIVLFGIS